MFLYDTYIQTYGLLQKHKFLDQFFDFLQKCCVWHVLRLSRFCYINAFKSDFIVSCSGRTTEPPVEYNFPKQEISKGDGPLALPFTQVLQDGLLIVTLINASLLVPQFLFSVFSTYIYLCIFLHALLSIFIFKPFLFNLLSILPWPYCYLCNIFMKDNYIDLRKMGLIVTGSDATYMNMTFTWECIYQVCHFPELPSLILSWRCCS